MLGDVVGNEIAGNGARVKCVEGGSDPPVRVAVGVDPQLILGLGNEVGKGGVHCRASRWSWHADGLPLGCRHWLVFHCVVIHPHRAIPADLGVVLGETVGGKMERRAAAPIPFDSHIVESRGRIVTERVVVSPNEHQLVVAQCGDNDGLALGLPFRCAVESRASVEGNPAFRQGVVRQAVGHCSAGFKVHGVGHQGHP